MRLWHIDLIPYLPKSQLIAQWRELNSIFKKQDKHILINYIYNYPECFLKYYSDAVIKEMQKRGIRINSYDNYDNYFGDTKSYPERFKEHNDEYLIICFFNLREKYIRGQKDFTKEIWDKLNEYCNFRLNHIYFKMLNLVKYEMIITENYKEEHKDD